LECRITCGESRDGIHGHQFNKRLELLHAIHSPFYLWILKKTILFSGFKNPYKKIRETRKLESIHRWLFVEGKNEGGKPDKNSSQRRLEFIKRYLD
jgi:hypothetical protein